MFLPNVPLIVELPAELDRAETGLIKWWPALPIKKKKLNKNAPYEFMFIYYLDFGFCGSKF